MHAFLVVASERGQESHRYRWVPLSDASSVFSHAEGVIHEMERTMDAVGLSELGIDENTLRDDTSLTPEVRAEKIDQDTTLLDF